MQAIKSGNIQNAQRYLAARASGLPRSAIREVMSLASQNPNVIHLERGEPDFTTPTSIVEEAFDKVLAGASRYTAIDGMMRLRELAAIRAGERGGVTIDADRIVITSGAIGALYSAVFTVLDAGDEMLIPEPGWPNYASLCHIAGVAPVRYRLESSNGFVPKVSQLEELVTERTKALLINNPGNPTGAVFSRGDIEAIAKFCRRRGIFLVSDEIYEDIVFDQPHISVSSVMEPDEYMIISGVSKSYAMTGWRIGYLVTPACLQPYAAGLQEPVTSCPSTPGQVAAIAALEGSSVFIAEGREIFKRRRDIFASMLNNTSYLPFIPRGAFYGLVDISDSRLNSLEFAKRLLLEHAVAVVPGITFGSSCDHFVRVAFTTSDDQLVTGLERLSDFVARQPR